jgi:transcriptional regulator with XRE-family HTH domain
MTRSAKHLAAAALDADAPDREVGARLKAIRTQFGLSQRELARRAGLTNGSVSLIEQGQVNPSVGSLRRLTHALSLTLSEFFTFDLERLGDTPFFKAAALPEIGTGQVSLRLVGPTTKARGLQVLHERYAPGADTGEELLSHQGEEAGVVTRGKVLVLVGNEERVLGPGDAYYFQSRIPHRFRNVGAEECEIVSAATEPSL